MILSSIQFAQEKCYWILLKNHDQDALIANILDRYPGSVPVIIHYQESKETLAIDGKFIAITNDFENEIATIAMKTIYK